jgi:putative restriction endonuclease
MTLDRKLLFYFVRDALAPYSEDFRIEERTNPVELRLNDRRYSTHISYVHDSGENRSNDDEVRIQIGRALIETQRERHRAGTRVAFVGFFEDGKTFIGWDPRHVFSLEAQRMVSIYARQSQEKSTETNQASIHRFDAKLLGEESFAIALPSTALGFYLENLEHFHRLPNEAAIVDLMQEHIGAFVDVGMGQTETFEFEEAGQREKFTFSRRAYPRDPKFKKAVLDAYEQTCCICDRQLALVQAAHIIPHADDDSPNTVNNGLALCIEHHRLYDDALLLPGPGRRLVFNTDRANFLKQTNQHKGLDAIEARAGNKYRIPKNSALHPRDDFLERGLKARMPE